MKPAPPSALLSVLVIDESRGRAEDLCRALVACGHQVAAVLPSAIELAARVEALRPDVILIETDSPSRDTLEHLAVMNRDAPRPVVIFARDGETAVIRDAVRAGVSAYVVDGLEAHRVRPVIEVALARFEAHQALRRELEDTARKLSERKCVERAKGVLMKARGLDEDAAYKALRKLAMDRGQSLGAAAADVIDMARLLL